MSITIYEKTPSGLYATGQRSVSTFPSGLIRVDQTFVCKTSAAATHRATLAVGNNFPGGSEPAVDGLKIFPEVQERRRDDGFTEFLVSGYGRTKTTATLKHKIKTFDFQYWGYSVYETTGKICVPSSSGIAYPDLGLASSYSDPMSPYERIANSYAVSLEVLATRTIDFPKYNGTTYQRRSRYYALKLDTHKWRSFWLADPAVEYTQENDFGAFKEIEFKAVPVNSWGLNYSIPTTP